MDSRRSTTMWRGSSIGSAARRDGLELLEPRANVAAHHVEARRDEQPFLIPRRIVRRGGDPLHVPLVESFLGLEAAELSERREEAGAVNFQAAFLAQHAEFERVPVKTSNAFD